MRACASERVREEGDKTAKRRGRGGRRIKGPRRTTSSLVFISRSLLPSFLPSFALYILLLSRKSSQYVSAASLRGRTKREKNEVYIYTHTLLYESVSMYVCVKGKGRARRLLMHSYPCPRRKEELIVSTKRCARCAHTSKSVYAGLFRTMSLPRG